MPLFEFKCKKCGKEFEELMMSSTREEIAKCPKCGSSKTEKLLSTFASGTTGKCQGASECPQGGGGG